MNTDNNNNNNNNIDDDRIPMIELYESDDNDDDDDDDYDVNENYIENSLDLNTPSGNDNIDENNEEEEEEDDGEYVEEGEDEDIDVMYEDEEDSPHGDAYYSNHIVKELCKVDLKEVPTDREQSYRDQISIFNHRPDIINRIAVSQKISSSRAKYLLELKMLS